MNSDRLETYIEQLEKLTPDSLDHLLDRVSPTVRFCDPFNDCRGKDNFRAVFVDMLANLEAHAFNVTAHAWCDGELKQQALMTWRLEAKLVRFGARPWAAEGSSVILFDAAGLVAQHIDHWDAAGQLYTHLPVIGSLMRYLQRRLGVLSRT